MSVFSPAGNTQVVSVTGTSGSVALTASNTVVRFYNAGPGTAFVTWSNDPALVASATSSVPIPPGDVECFEKGRSTVLAVIADTTASLYITQGEGE